MQADQVPAELVEAAARAWWEHDAEGMAAWCNQVGVESDPTWDEISDADRDHVRQSIAAPTLAAVYREVQARALEAEASRIVGLAGSGPVGDPQTIAWLRTAGAQTARWLRASAAEYRTPDAGVGGGERG